MNAPEIDPDSTILRPLAEYSDRLPSSRRGKRLNRATLWRWALQGSNGVFLRTVKLGGSRCTCDAWICEFIEQLSQGTRPPATCESDPSSRARIRARFGIVSEGKT